jgi:CRISPR-associated endonuclease/helicase Cas3
LAQCQAISQMTIFAHSLAGAPPERWEQLRDHLEKVAQLAGEFAALFESAEWGRLAGLWHDLGKYRPEFQRRLCGSGQQVEHAGLGAALAAEKGRTGVPLAFVIAGHHAGLANRNARGESDITPLGQRLARNKGPLEAVRESVPQELLDPPLPPLPPYLEGLKGGPDVTARRWELWTRVLFSALVDADRLATEAFCNPAKAEKRASLYAPIPELRSRLDAVLAGFVADTPVNRIRAQVLGDCRLAANHEPGFFSLTAPTGAGKTLSSMAFALAHAERYGLRRVIVVVPYTTIIEQNADVYRKALGSKNVIEHHASIDEEVRREQHGEAEVHRQLATENWDAPVIVTTTVQFFESLFSNRSSRCRKVHNVVRSVIVLDEAQSLPAGYLSCLLDVTQELVDVYRCSIVISTATQPALARRESLPDGLQGVREIVRTPIQIAQALTRVEIQWPEVGSPPVAYGDLAGQLAQHEQVLAVVHLRRDARQLAEALPGEGRHHLSALMCPAHRAKVLEQVRTALPLGQRCRLVATQLVEAGVDVDFPVVYRALAGLDSLAQAAGRCNREGKLDSGTFIVFPAETKPPAGILRIGLDATNAMLERHAGRLNFADPTFFDEYFRILYHTTDRDRRGVQVEREQLNFANVAQLVELVEDGYKRAVVVLWEDAGRRVAIHRAERSRRSLRALQRFVVQIPERDLRTLATIGAVEEINECLHVLTPAFRHLYHSEFGLVVDDSAAPDPAAQIV